jgi:hypothetical protein
MKYTHILPFLDKEEIKKTALDIINGNLKGVKLEVLFAFLGREAMDEVVDLLIEKKDSAHLKRAIPFMSREKVQKLYEAAEKGEITDFNPAHCLPFLGSDEIKKIFGEMLKKASMETKDDGEEDDEDDDIADLEDEA